MPPKTQNEIGDIAMNLNRIANLLSLLATQDMSEGDKVGTLSAAGFGASEIARILNKDPNTVHVFLSLRRKKSRKRK